MTKTGFAAIRSRRALLGSFALTFPLALTLSVWLMAPPAAAHGVLERSDPPANAALDAPPRQVVLWFNEPVDPAFSSVAVLDRDGRRVGQPPAVSRDGRQFLVDVGALARGVYTVRWRILSTVDGHTTAGVFAFAVGEAAPSGLGTASVAGPGPVRVAVRWIGFLAAALLAGGAFFQITVLRPGLARLEPPEALRIGETLASRLRPVTVIAALALLLSVVVQFTLEATTLLDAPLLQAIAGGMLWPLLGGTKAGYSALARASMVLILLPTRSPGGRILQAAALPWFIVVGSLTALLGGPTAIAGSIHLTVIGLAAVVYGLVGVMMAAILPQVPDFRLPAFAWVPPVAGAALLGGITIGSHASGSPLAAIADWLHLLAAAFWIGGLTCLLLVLRTAAPSDRQRLSQVLVPRFSTVAGISLGVVIATGLYSAWVNLPGLRALTVTAYGRALLLKLLLIVPLVTLGALNRFVLRPRLAAATGGSHAGVLRRFLRFVTGEVGVAALVLLVVAVLTITPPAKVTMPAAAQKPLTLVGLAEDVQVRLTITPALPGWNRLEVVAAARDGQATGPESRIFLRLTKLEDDLEPTTVPLIPQGQWRYVAEGGSLGLPGWWSAEVVVRRKGRPDVSTVFPLRLGQRPVPPSDSAALRILEEAEQAITRLSAWRQVEQITDGSGGYVVVRYELVSPDRLRYRTSGGDEAVIIGSTQYLRAASGGWEKRTLPQPVVVGGLLKEYIEGGVGVVKGRQAACEAEPCSVVLWEARERTAAFAAWIGTASRRIHRVMMVAPSHFMTLTATDFDAPLRVTTPE